MVVTREVIVKAVIQGLQEAQQSVAGGPEEITEDTCPLEDLKDFDSLASVSVTMHCLESLGCPDSLSLKSPTLFIDKNEKALTVGEVVNRILKLLRTEKS